MNLDSPERAHARETMDKAIRDYVKIVARENGTSIELEADDATGNCNLIPPGQAAAMSRGLMHFGVNAMSRVVTS